MNHICCFLLSIVLVLGGLLPTGMTTAKAEPSFDCSLVTEIPETECEALVTLYNSTGGPDWIDQTNWLANNLPGTWYGVGVISDHVVGLTLFSNHLTGAIPPELANLTFLSSIHLARNALTGSIPTELSGLTNLTSLMLYDNQLAGSLPPELGNLTALRFLMVADNHLSGSIPTELGALTNLENLDLRGNLLTGSIPAELGNLTKLFLSVSVQ